MVFSCLSCFAIINVSATQDRTSYFNKNYTLTGNPIDDIVAVAQAQANRTKAQMGYTEAWCANFVGDCASLAGLGDIIPRNGYCGTLYSNILNAGGKEVTSPQKGDIIFYYCTASSCPNSGKPWVHVGIMTSPTSSIEGNSGGKVAVKSKVTYTDMNGHTYGHSGTNSVIAKYLRPNYPPQEPEIKYWYEDLELVNLGDNFSARIRNIALDVLVTNFNGNIVIGKHYDHKIARQIWNFTRNSDGSYKIKSCLNDYCMELHNFDDFDGGNITCIPENGSTAQDWFIYLNPDGSYSMRPKCSDERIMDVTNGDSTDGNNLQLWSYNNTYSQKFSIEKCGEVVNLGDVFAASIEHTDYWKPIYQDDTGNVVLTTSSREKMSGILWYFDRDETNGWYTITSYKNAKCLEVENNSTEPGANVQCGDYIGDYGQHWFILKAIDSEGNEYCYIKSACSSNNLDLDCNSEADGTNIKMWTLNGSDAQKFTIYKLDDQRDKISYKLIANNSNIDLGDSVTIEITNALFAIDYKLYIVNPDGSMDTIDLNMNNKYRFSPNKVGKYKIFASVASPVSSYTGSENDNYIEIVVNENNKVGDVNGDGDVNVIDATMVQKHLAELTRLSEDKLKCADTDKDGVVSIKDSTQIQKYIAQLITTF